MAVRIVKSFCLGLILTFFLFIPSLMADTASQVFDKTPLDHSWRKGELRQAPAKRDNASGWGIYATTTTTTMNPRVFQEIDALNYTIDVHLYPGAYPYPDFAYITATSSIQAKAKASILNEMVIDFYDNITITSLKLNGIEFATFSRSDNKIWMNLSSNPIQPNAEFIVTIEYTCVISDMWQGLLFRIHPRTDPNGTQVYYSMNQPYYSPGWYPCFDYPSDKVTVDMYITCPDWMVVVANGLPQAGYPIDNHDGTKTHYWKENYQIYTSVIAVNMTDYVTWTDTYTSPLDGTTMPLTYYVFPEDEVNARATFGINEEAMVFYAQKFGEYPFINEKYGIAEVANPFGSMEHQTITALTFRSTQSAINWDVQVHELAHQWWGDWVTCDTWHHVWLDEGLATYAEILFHEYYTGVPAGTFIDSNYDDKLYAGRLAGTVYAEDLSNPWDDEGAIYDKAGWVVHMLRHMLGDTQFFAAVKAYGLAHAEKTAVTDDLRTVMESHYGEQSLVDFFNQWVYTPYRPVYSITYLKSNLGGNYKVDITVQQTQTHSVVDISGTVLRDYYIMPLDFTVHYTDQTTETFTFQNTGRNQNFAIITSKEPDHIVFDEQINILKIKSEIMTNQTTTTTINISSTTTTTELTPTSTTTTVSPPSSTTAPPSTTTTAQPTLIQLASFTATRGLGKVILEWTTESELDNAGFNILRAEAEEGEYVKINDALIPAKGSLMQGVSYEFVDSDVRAGKLYWYKLEDIDLNGKSTTHGPVKAYPRLIDGIRK